MKLPSFTHWLAALVFSVFVTLPFMPFASDTAPRYRFEVEISNTQFGIAQLFYDTGAGLSEQASQRIEIVPGAPRQVRFELPSGHYRALRFDPTDRPGVVTLSRAVLVSPTGTVIRRFTAGDFKAVQGIDRAVQEGDTLTVTPSAGSSDPIMDVALGANLELASTRTPLWQALSVTTLPMLLITLALLTAASGRGLGAGWIRHLPGSSHPLRALALAAAVAVVISNYPIIFFGKSFASPNYGAALLYDTTPTLPGMTDRRTEDVKGSDVGPLFWQNMTHTMIQRDALLAGEWPLWFRYNSVGTELIGQGQSMFGDPLHFLVIIFSGSAWAWDAKFLIAKFLLAFGLGYLAFKSTRHLPGAILVAFSAAFFGFFSFRINHPSFFTFCYAPWILVGWFKLREASHLRPRLIASGWLLLGNWAVLNSGTAKEAYMLLLSLNVAGTVVILMDDASWRQRLASLAAAGGTGVVLILLSAPIWLTFLDALKASYTSYNAPSAWQIHPSFLLGLFDEIFYRPLQPGERVSNPSLNFIILGGILYLAVTWRASNPGRIATALALVCVPAGLLAFGVVPPQWIQAVPFLGNVAHIDNCFSLVLIVLLSILAASGFKAAAERLGTPSGRGDLFIAAILLVLLILPWISSAHTVHKPLYSDGERFTLHGFGETLAISPFVWASLLVLPTALFLAGWTLQGWRAGKIATAPAVLLLTTLSALLVARHTQHVGNAFHDYVVNPPERPSLLARSEAVEAVRADMKTPTRAVGIEGNLFPGWAAAYRFEGISGPEALMNPRFRELAEALGIDRVWDWRLMVHTDGLDRMRKRYDALNIGYYLDYRSDQGKVGKLLTPLKMADLDVYRSDTVWPRAFFTDRLGTYGDVRDFARLISDGDGLPFAVATADEPLRPSFLRPALAGRTVVPAHDYTLTPNSTRFIIDTPGAGIAVLTEAWQDKNFRAVLDGKPVPYLRVNHAFKGIVISSPGRHVIEFTFAPRRFTLALGLAGLGLLPIIAAGWLIWRLRPTTRQA